MAWLHGASACQGYRVMNYGSPGAVLRLWGAVLRVMVSVLCYGL